MSNSNDKPAISQLTWVILIALGVVLGLFLWSTGNALYGTWQKHIESKREEEQTRQSEIQRALERQKSEESANRQMKEFKEWSERSTFWHKIFSTAQEGSNGTFDERIEAQAAYQDRLRQIGLRRLLEEELEALESDKRATEKNADNMRRVIGRELPDNSSRRLNLDGRIITIRGALSKF